MVSPLPGVRTPNLPSVPLPLSVITQNASVTGQTTVDEMATTLASVGALADLISTLLQMTGAVVAKASLSELAGVAGSYVNGDIGLVLLDVDETKRGVYRLQAGAWVKIDELPADIARAAVAAAEAFRDQAEIQRIAAETARDIAAGYASDAVSQGNVPIYATIAGMPAMTVPAGISAIRVNGNSAVGDGGGGFFVDSNNGHGAAFSSGGGTARTWYLASTDPVAAQEFNLDSFRTAIDATDDNALDRILALITDNRVYRITRPHDRETVLSARHSVLNKKIVFGGGRHMRVTTADAGFYIRHADVSSQACGFFLVEHVDVLIDVARTAGAAGCIFGYEQRFIGSFDQTCGGFNDVTFRVSDVNDPTITIGTPLYVKNGWYGIVKDCAAQGPNGGLVGNLIKLDGLCAQWLIDNPLTRFLDTAISINWAVLTGINFAAAPAFTAYETVVGQTSGATGVCVASNDYATMTRILVDEITGAFTPGETIVGQTSGYSAASTTIVTRKYPCEGIDIRAGASLATNHYVTAIMPSDISRRGVGLTFSGGHGSCVGSTIKTAFFDQITLTGKEPLYRQNGTGADLEIDSCSGFYIGGFVFTGTGTTAAAMVLTNCGDGIIAPNAIALRSIGVQINAGCARIDVHAQANGNGVTTPYVVDGSVPVWPAANGIRFLDLHDRPFPQVPILTISDGVSRPALAITNPGTNISTSLFTIDTATSQSIGTQFHFANFTSDSGTQSKIRMRGDGTIFVDVGTVASPADYAEMWEWEDGNPDAEDRTGWTVTLVGDKIRKAVEGDIPIGVVSAAPAVLGDAAWSRWSGMFLRDELNRPIFEDCHIATWEELVALPVQSDGPGPRYDVADRSETKSAVVEDTPAGVIPLNAEIVVVKRQKLNPDYEPSQPYVPRGDRKEWSAIGLLGKLPVLVGSVVAPTWIKMKSLSAEVDQYFVK